MSHARYLVGDVFERMAELEDDSVDLVLTSPPFLALRSYLPADHPDKGKEIGSEATPAEFVDTLLALSAEWRRVLAPHGSIAVELGDTFSGSGGDNNLYTSGYSGGVHGLDTKKPDGPGVRRDISTGWPQAKSLALVPEAYRFALAYGMNPHTGQSSPAGQWRVRNVIRWVRPNPPVGALGDKFRPATSEMVIATIAKDRYFDLDAVRTPWGDDGPPERPQNPALAASPTKGNTMIEGKIMKSNPVGSPPLDWWKISPTGYAGAHYAVWPPELCIKPIKAMTPEKVCRECGKPSRRIVDVAPGAGGYHPGNNGGESTANTIRLTRHATTTGWTDCGHDNYRPGIVFDPFAGTGTTLAVATGHGRDGIGIDIDSRNADLARERVGDLFLTVETRVTS